MIAGFEFWNRGPLLLREERVTSRAATQGSAAWTLLYASDLHLTARRGARFESLLAALVDQTRAARPDVVLLGGDLVDSRAGSEALAECVRRLAEFAPVAAVAGNHDAAAGLASVRAAVGAGGGHWLHDAPLALASGGRRPLLCAAVADDAAEATAALDASALRVLVGHHPNAAAAAARGGFDVAFAGHLHGGQCVLWQRGTHLYPGAFFSRWNGLRFALGSATLLVSRGVADTLPVRFRCPREVVRCQLT